MKHPRTYSGDEQPYKTKEISVKNRWCVKVEQIVILVFPQNTFNLLNNNLFHFLSAYLLSKPCLMESNIPQIGGIIMLRLVTVFQNSAM